MILAVLSEAPDVGKEPTPSVWLVGYGDSAVNFTIKFFIEDYRRLEHDPERGDGPTVVCLPA